MKKVKLAKLPKGHKRITIKEENFVDVIGCIETFCKRNKFKVDRVEVINARFCSAKPEELASIILKGEVEIDGERYFAEVCGDEMIIGDKLPDLANYLAYKTKIVIPA